MALSKIDVANMLTGTIPTSVGGTGSTAATLPASLINNTSIGNVTALPAAVEGMDRLATTAISSDVASVTFDVNHNNDSTFNNYSHYIIYIANFLGDGASGELKFRIGVSDSSDIKTADYMNQLFEYKPNAGSTIIAGADTNAGDIRMGNDVDFDNTSRPMFGEIHFYKKGNVGTSYKPGAYGFFYAENINGYFGTWHFHGSYEVAHDINYAQIVPSTGNIAKGEFTLMGVRNS
jgi:hypothetical protein